MTGNGEQEQAAELARQAEALREQAPPIFSAGQQYLAAARPADAGAPQWLPSLGRQVGEALDLGMADVITAVQKFAPWLASASLSGEGTLAAGGLVMGSASLSGEGTLVAFADVGTATDSLSVVKAEDIGELSVRASRDGIAGLSIMQVLALVLVWLLVGIGTSAVQQLPPEAQAKLANDIGILSVGLMMTLAIVQKRKR